MTSSILIQHLDDGLLDVGQELRTVSLVGLGRTHHVAVELLRILPSQKCVSHVVYFQNLVQKLKFLREFDGQVSLEVLNSFVELAGLDLYVVPADVLSVVNNVPDNLVLQHQGNIVDLASPHRVEVVHGLNSRLLHELPCVFGFCDLALSFSHLDAN